MEEKTESRPNIRIEIQNNLVESMEIDQNALSDGEEGEICDSIELDEVNQDITYISRPNHTEKVNVKKFETGINIFDKQEQEKLKERAKRFQLKPDEINNFTEKNLNDLHESLGINGENDEKIRFEAVHMHGVNQMTSLDVLEYFGKYSPYAIEWIDNESCNVIWNETNTAARALFQTSKVIKGISTEAPSDPFFNELKAMEESGRSILLKNKHRDIELRDDELDKENDSEANLSDITIPIPDGFWRLGIPHYKAKCILLRYTLKTDKTPFKTEKFGQLTRKHTNINFSGIKEIITENKKGNIKGILNSDSKMEQNKNPWGSLAKNWYRDSRYAEPEARVVVLPKKTSNLQHRLGFKRAFADEKLTVQEDEEKKTKIPRMRMYADEEEAKIKRKLQLKALKRGVVKEEKKVEDLRQVLSSSRKKPEVIQNYALDHLRIIEIEKPRQEEERLQKDIRMRLEERSILRASTEKQKKTNFKHRKEQILLADDDYDNSKTNSKVTVVIKKKKAPAVASTVWSRIPNERDRLKTVSEGKLRVRRDSTSSESSSASSCIHNSTSSISESEGENVPATKIERPGFTNDYKFEMEKQKAPLKMEIKIKNDLYNKN